MLQLKNIEVQANEHILTLVSFADCMVLPLKALALVMVDTDVSSVTEVASVASSFGKAGCVKGKSLVVSF